MAVWRAVAIATFPQLTLTNWSVFEVELGAAVEDCTRHFVGVTTAPRRCAQVSSPVLMFDRATGRGITESGRAYQLLQGQDGSPASVLRTWTRWKEINHIVAEKDVTQLVAREMRSR